MPEEKVLKWQSVISAISGIIATAWTFPVRCLVNRRFHGSVKSVPTVCECTYKVGVIVNPRRACAERVTVVVSFVCVCVCVSVSVCLSEHAILAVRAVRSITKDAIVLSVRFAAILKGIFLKTALFES